MAGSDWGVPWTFIAMDYPRGNNFYVQGVGNFLVLEKVPTQDTSTLVFKLIQLSFAFSTHLPLSAVFTDIESTNRS